MNYQIKKITKLYRFSTKRKINEVCDFSNKDYYIDTNGNLYHKNHKLVNVRNNMGYVTNYMKDNQGKGKCFLRHQIVAQVFMMDEYEEGKTVDHINRIRDDNRLENLRWATPAVQTQNRTVEIVIGNEVLDVMHPKYVQKIDDIREFFTKNMIRSFNKSKYKYLSLLYDLYDYAYNEKEIDDEVLKSYLDGYEIQELNSENMYKIRSNFYDFFYERIKNYQYDKSKKIANTIDIDCVDLIEFGAIFKDKRYIKKELKKYLIERFCISNDVFKNKNTIEDFLFRIGYIIRKNNGNYVLRSV